jgi:hypothetical protein
MEDQKRLVIAGATDFGYRSLLSKNQSRSASPRQKENSAQRQKNSGSAQKEAAAK